MAANDARYAVGIDLGTTHTTLAFIDLDLTDGESAPPQIFSVPQALSANTVEAKPLLPSFLYLSHPSENINSLEFSTSNHRERVVGEFARTRGAEVPSRLVSSAKSWLCHAGVDRRASFLPKAPAGVPDAPELNKVSPVEASRAYLEHLRDAWNHKFARVDNGCLLEAQDIVLTVPASFDAAARELTAEAASLAGFKNLTLLEEPQAALYSWVENSSGKWRKETRVGDVILVIDVGGGTTDFSAIAVQEHDGNLELVRVAVGDHILLGGDNMDLAIGYFVKQKLSAQGKELDSWQMQSLVHQARIAKELLLSRSDVQSAPMVVASRGAKLFGGTIRTELTRSELSQVLFDGFFPDVLSSDRPRVRARAAFTQLGLPYANDAAITRHLAAFLAKQATSTDSLSGYQSGRTFLQPTAVLFNGGVMKGEDLRARVMGTLNRWLHEVGASPARVIEGVDLDLAVARGAAYYAYAKRGRGVRIRGGTARSYYIGIESAMPAVPGIEPPVSAMCVAPFGMEEGVHADVPPIELGLVVGEPVRFRFFGSTSRRDDKVGHVLDRWSPDELTELPSIEGHLQAINRAPGEVVPVHLQSSLTEVGTLLLEAIEATPRAIPERWKLELNVRDEGTFDQ